MNATSYGKDSAAVFIPRKHLTSSLRHHLIVKKPRLDLFCALTTLEKPLKF